MVNVVLPSIDPAAISYVTSTLNSSYNIYMVTGAVGDSRPGSEGRSILFTRLSAQVYLELADFTQLAALVPALLLQYNDLPRE